MKEMFKIFKFVLLICGVFGADEDEVKTVMEGDSVTLNLDPTQIQGFIQIQWRFGKLGSTIAKIVGKTISYEDEEIFEDCLQLDQTGSLTIKNMRTKHSGRYKAEISHSTGTLDIIFIVTVFVSPDVIDAVKGGMKLMSVTEGDPVILQTDVPQLTRDMLVVWRSGDEGKLIAKHDIEAKSSPFYVETDGRFRDRLKLDQTGSLTITNSRTNDSGLYRVKISSNNQTTYKRFTVTVSVPGLSGAAVAWIVIVLLLLAAAVAGVMYFYLRPRITNLPNQTWLVPAGDYITLNPETEIQRGDEIQWLFGAEDTVIAEIKGENREITRYDGLDKIIIYTLELDKTTGSLTIPDTTTNHTALYTLKIRRGRETFYKIFHVSVVERKISVMEGDRVPLFPDTDIQKSDEVQWLFDDKEQTVLTEIKNTKVTGYTGTDWRFRDRLELIKETGLLTIKKFTAAHTGHYTMKITRDRYTFYKRFYIYAEERKIAVMEGEFVTLNPAYEIKKDDAIQLLFGDRELQTDITQYKVETGKISPYDNVADERFRDRLELDKTTGSLIINNTTTAHSGVYKLEIRSSSGVTEQIFIVTVREKVEEILLEEDCVTLKPHTEIQRDDQILWMFGDQDKLIAQIRGGTVETYDDVNKRFRDRLKLDKTGSLTITKIEAEQTGRYKLMISSSSGEILVKRFKVSIQPRDVEVTVGESVRLNTGLNEKLRDEEIEWRFGYKNSLIAEIKGGTGKTYDGPNGINRGRLELDEKTRDLTIKNSTDEHAGRYTLKIRSSKGNTYRIYRVNVKARDVEVTVGESVHLHTGFNEIQIDDEIEWMFGDEKSPIAKIKGGTGKTHDGPFELFIDRLELDKKTGDLTIKNSRAQHSGRYTLKIRNSEGNTYSTYIVTIRDDTENRVNESATVEIEKKTLLNREDVVVVNEERMSSL